jgi:cytochrome c-type biogenesis protein CcmE
VGAALEGTLVYAKTPAELRSDPHSVGLHTRVEGTVVPGSLHEGKGTADFVLSEGGASLRVEATQAPPGAFREGQDAVVEGSLGTDGTFVADAVVAKHGNVYRAPAAGGAK